ncbi:MAG: hypothetical protein ACMVY4_10220 [Minwuia sp.]|uniref:hypothetical protein n=1 Tax=Minwuia sp. TaxID=2493630 RepID=UPI003A861525
MAPRPVLVASALTPLADGGNARAALLVGRLHADPKSPVYDPVRAKAYLDPIGSANAQLLLAEMYAANGPDQDVVEAEIYYRQAMASGEEFARYRLAVMFVRQGASRSKVQQTLQPMLDAGDERAVNLLALVPE